MSSLSAPLTPTQSTLIGRIFPALQSLSALKFIVLALLGSALLVLSSKIIIPFYPVSISMQSFMVIALGCLYGSRLATATVTLYLFEGAIGIPVFQGPGAGIIYMISVPTAGYLVGFVLSAYSVGRLFEYGLGRSVLSAALLFVIGAVIIDIPGLIWLTHLVGFDLAKTTYLTYQYAFLLKTGLGAMSVPALWHHHSVEK